MADDFLSFMSSIGSTPQKVYGSSAEDAARRQAIGAASQYWNATTPAQTGYMPAADGATYQNPGNMYAPTYGGSGTTRPVKTTTVGPIDRSTAANNYFGQAVTYFPASGKASIADLLTGVGSYGGPASLSQQPAQTAAKGGYAPWGAYSRSLAYNSLNSDPAPAQNVQLPRPRPGYAPTALDMAAINAPRQPVGANPGMGGAMLGNGVMSPAIPPQQPPADGSSPLPVWAGETPHVPQMPQAGGYTAPGAPRPLSAAERYQLANQYGQQAALQRQANATGTAGGYQYVNGQKVGYAPQTIGNNVYTPTNPATAYGLANAAGQIAALNRQAAAMSQGQQTAIQKLQAQGMSPSQAYAAANAAPGSVAAWDQRFAGGTQSGAPAVGGSYGGGGGGDGNSRGTPGIQYRR